MDKKVIVGLILIVSSAILIFLCLFRKKETFFNINEVIQNHLLIFKDCPYQYFVFYFFPLVFAIGLALIYQAGKGFYSELSIILGILLSILLAVLSILAGYDFSTVCDEKQRERAKNVVSETINAIVFNSILCLFLMLYGLVIVVIEDVDFSWIQCDLSVLKTIAAGTAYYIFAVILLTLLLIIKHMSRIIEFNLTVKKDNENKQ